MARPVHGCSEVLVGWMWTGWATGHTTVTCWDTLCYYGLQLHPFPTQHLHTHTHNTHTDPHTNHTNTTCTIIHTQTWRVTHTHTWIPTHTQHTHKPYKHNKHNNLHPNMVTCTDRQVTATEMQHMYSMWGVCQGNSDLRFTTVTEIKGRRALYCFYPNMDLRMARHPQWKLYVSQYTATVAPDS